MAAFQVIHHPRERAEEMAAHDLMKRFPKLLRSSAWKNLSIYIYYLYGIFINSIPIQYIIYLYSISVYLYIYSIYVSIQYISMLFRKLDVCMILSGPLATSGNTQGPKPVEKTVPVHGRLADATKAKKYRGVSCVWHVLNHEFLFSWETASRKRLFGLCFSGLSAPEAEAK